MKIKLTTVNVDDQDRALRFYTEVLGFTKKADFSNGGFRWLTVASPDEPDGPDPALRAAPADENGCGCRTAGGAPSGGLGTAGALLALALVALRSRRAHSGSR